MAIENGSNPLLIFTDSEPGKEFVSTLERELNVSSQIFVLDSFWIVKVNKTIWSSRRLLHICLEGFPKKKRGPVHVLPSASDRFLLQCFHAICFSLR